jgi:sirohydrochlorin ferrochelatase
MSAARRPIAMATDGQGVILATPHSVDARQRTALDLLGRRVAHRLGCPVAVGQVQNGVLHLDAPISTLHAKGAREIVVAPLTFAPMPMISDRTPPNREGARQFAGVSLRTADPLGGEPEVIDAVVEVLSNSERTPNPNTRIVMALPHADHPAVPALSAHVGALARAGWKQGVVVAMPPTDAPADLDGVLSVAPHERVLMVPLTIAPGAFGSRIADFARRSGVESASVSLHSADSLTRLICRRVSAARRA